MNPPESFQTARLTLRKPVPADASLLFNSYAQDPEVTRFLRWHPHSSVSDCEGHIEHSLQQWAAGSTFIWFLFHRANDELVGSIAARPQHRDIELGYVLARPWWGRGLMFEAINCIADWAFHQPQISRLTAFCDIENGASARVLEKAGFTRTGMLKRHSIHPNISDEPRDCYAYSRDRPG